MLFPENKRPPGVVLYLGKVLPPAVMGLLLLTLLAGCGQTQKVPPEPDETLAAEAAVYAAIAEDLTFTMTVEEADGTVTELDIVPDNAWNVKGRENIFPISYQWCPADKADWKTQLAAEEGGDLFTMADETGTMA